MHKLSIAILTWTLTAGALGAANVPGREAPAHQGVTFYEDVLPVLRQRCQGCHRPGEIGPMSFLTYEGTRPWAAAIREAVLTNRMPPWFAEPGVGPAFHNDRTMSPREQEVLSAWAETGSQAGDPTKAPAPVEFVDGWNIEPDQVMTIPPFEIPADGVIEYTYLHRQEPLPRRPLGPHDGTTAVQPFAGSSLGGLSAPARVELSQRLPLG